MEVKPGYKQTEVGVIPEDWKVLPLGTHFHFKNGLNKAKEFFGHGTPIVNYMDVFQRPHLRVRDIRGSVDVSASERRAYEVRQGDVFFTRTSETVDEIGVASVMLDEVEDTVFSGFVLRARPTDKVLDDGFKGYCFAARYFRQQVTALASYTTRALTNGRSLSAALLAEPPLAEQRAIAAALSDVDALLGGLDRLIAKKRDLKQAAMQQLLTGQTRLPGFHGEWDVKRLGDLAEIVSGGTPRTSEPSYWNGAIKWCTPTDITRYAGKYITETERTISRDGLNSSGAMLLPVGALLLCSRATIGEIKIAGVPICTNQGFKSLICRPEASNEFLYYKLLTMKQQMVERAFGSTFLEISTRNVFSLGIATPPRDEQSAIAAVLSDIDAELSALESRRDKTRALKQGMMQELLTGRTRLVRPEHEMGA